MKHAEQLRRAREIVARMNRQSRELESAEQSGKWGERDEKSPAQTRQLIEHIEVPALEVLSDRPREKKREK